MQNTLEAIGASFEIVPEAAGLRRGAKILLPGVGNFGQIMRALDQLDVRATLKERIAAGVPFLGICLGLQALFERSAEAPDVDGLGIFEGSVERFPAGARVPHMGWNTVQSTKPSRLLERGREPYVYFANSYYVPVCAATAATCTYTNPFTAVLESGNIFGVQFHPEKSGAAGLEIVQRFAAL
ncbi:MAG: imidazole glycerol phosphate synthase subunit HisH [Verrucomicrobiota bacterium]|nr:imidazole glycerol phosphate synthase subunit HisH [Verrucomicrobiota bacterium]